jgi:hypothetical protein
MVGNSYLLLLLGGHLRSYFWPVRNRLDVLGYRRALSRSDFQPAKNRFW